MSIDQLSNSTYLDLEFVLQDRVPETTLLEGLAVHWSFIGTGPPLQNKEGGLSAAKSPLTR